MEESSSGRRGYQASPTSFSLLLNYLQVQLLTLLCARFSQLQNGDNNGIFLPPPFPSLLFGSEHVEYLNLS